MRPERCARVRLLYRIDAMMWGENLRVLAPLVFSCACSRSAFCLRILKSTSRGETDLPRGNQFPAGKVDRSYRRGGCATSRHDCSFSYRGETDLPRGKQAGSLLRMPNISFMTTQRKSPSRLTCRRMSALPMRHCAQRLNQLPAGKSVSRGETGWKPGPVVLLFKPVSRGEGGRRFNHVQSAKILQVEAKVSLTLQSSAPYTSTVAFQKPREAAKMCTSRRAGRPARARDESA